MAKKGIFDGDRTIKLVKQLIRYDIPFLLLGKSSIGKSYSIIEMSEQWRMPKSILYIGSEKPSNIEGLPRLTGQRAGTDTLEFYKPNWFPDTQLIERYVTNGKSLFDKYIEIFFDGNKKGCLSGKDFKSLHSIFEGLALWEWSDNIIKAEELKIPDPNKTMGVLNTTGMMVEREIYSDAEIIRMKTEAEEGQSVFVRDDVRDLCLYLSTLLGYGNYWLILDELDKVSEEETDKYAPLLHIVRERIIKDYSMRTLNGGKGSGVPNKVQIGSDYSLVKRNLDESIDNSMPLLDTRIIGIANATQNIEDALFRRFCHLIVEDVMMITQPDQSLDAMRQCLAKVTEGSGSEALTEGLDYKVLNEVNLQWQFGFFPRMLNEQDVLNNYILEDFMEILRISGLGLPEKEAIKKRKGDAGVLLDYTNTSALFKIIRNNFGIDDDMTSEYSVDMQANIYLCLAQEIMSKGLTGGSMGSEFVASEAEINLEAVDERIKEAVELDPVASGSVKILVNEQASQFAKAKRNDAYEAAIRESLQLIERASELRGTEFAQQLAVEMYPVLIGGIAKNPANADNIKKELSWVSLFYQQAIKEGLLSSFNEELMEAMVNPQDIQRLNKKMLETWMMNTARNEGRPQGDIYVTERFVKKAFEMYGAEGGRLGVLDALGDIAKDMPKAYKEGVKELLTNMPALREMARTRKKK